MNKGEKSGAPFIPMTGSEVGTATTSDNSAHHVSNGMLYPQNNSDDGRRITGAQTNRSPSAYPYFKHTSGDCNVTYSTNPGCRQQKGHPNHHLPNLQPHHPYPHPKEKQHLEGGSFTDRQPILSNQIPHFVPTCSSKVYLEPHAINSPSFPNSIACGNAPITCGNPVVSPAVMSQNPMACSGGKVSFLSMLQDMNTTDLGEQPGVDLGFPKPTVTMTNSDWRVNEDSETYAAHSRTHGTVLHTILEEM